MGPRTGGNKTLAARAVRKASTATHGKRDTVDQHAPPKKRPTPTKHPAQPHLLQVTGQYSGANRYDGGDFNDEHDGGKHDYSGRYDGEYDGEYSGEHDGGYNEEYDGGRNEEYVGGRNDEDDGGSNGDFDTSYDNSFRDSHGSDHRSKSYGGGDGNSEPGGGNTDSPAWAGFDEYGSEPEQYSQSQEQEVLEVSSDAEDLSNFSVPFDIPIEGVNHTERFPLDVSWDDFEWEVTRKLGFHPADVRLSYKLASQTKAEMPRALADEKDLEDLMRRSKPFVDGSKTCGRGKEFSVQLSMTRKTVASKNIPEPTPAQKGKGKGKGKGKQNVNPSGSKDNDEGGTAQKLISVERVSSTVKASSYCQTHDRSCAVSNTGDHVRLIPEDFSKWATLVAFGTATTEDCPELVIQEAQKREDKAKEQRDAEKAPKRSTQDPESRTPRVPLPNAIVPNPTPLPAANFATISPDANHPGQFIPNTAPSQQYGAPPVVHNSPATVNPFSAFPGHGYGHPAFQTGFDPQPLQFPQVPNNYYPPAPVMHNPYTNIPRQSYPPPHPYHNPYPPAYPPANWQPAGIPYTTPPPAFGTSWGHSDSLRRPRSPVPAVEIEDPSDYPELSDWLQRVDQHHLRGNWGHHFSQFSARFELEGFTSLLHLERVTLQDLIGMTGMETLAAERLRRFVREDIEDIRDSRPPRPKRMRYSY